MSKLYIDDLRNPQSEGFIIVRSSSEAIQYVSDNGIPDYISFDHDLGEDDTSMVFIHWMIGKILDGNLTIPEGFNYHVHSANPVGVKNIQGLLDSFLNHYRK